MACVATGIPEQALFGGRAMIFRNATALCYKFFGNELASLHKFDKARFSLERLNKSSLLCGLKLKYRIFNSIEGSL